MKSSGKLVRNLRRAASTLEKAGHTAEAEACADAADVIHGEVLRAEARKRRAIERLQELGLTSR